MSRIDHKDIEDDTPLHWAVILDKPDTVSFLLQNGAKKDELNINENSPLMLASLNKNLRIVQLLLQSTRTPEESKYLTN